ncbi:MAG: Zinc/iron permease [Candidatus Berkelbacteria bacterium Licking1014_7]|uniref:Zinc/iron permease n=1 Tax=Candidatus Berkelbacteria bacterium Licking1014_7 TaxID=2017147 RepID=A0A554LKV6_9BACT|nr:MAG: Zinc/iron permease [Candidatus Berkelbacteria bacterium Licking1014_7]
MILFYIIIFTVLGSVGAIILSALLISFGQKRLDKLAHYLISFAAGALLANVFLDLLPHSLERVQSEIILPIVLSGILFFILLEKIIIWHHCHNKDCAQNNHNTSGTMILIGDGFHNFVDGVIVAGSFLVSAPLGISVGFSVIIHEIAQEIGDLGILLHSGYEKKRAIFLNILSGIVSLPAGILTYFILRPLENTLPFVMAFASASFIYIALTDLIPELHKKAQPSHFYRHFLLILLGVGIIYLLD